jgi:hypothetical protein
MHAHKIQQSSMMPARAEQYESFDDDPVPSENEMASIDVPATPEAVEPKFEPATTMEAAPAPPTCVEVAPVASAQAAAFTFDDGVSVPRTVKIEGRELTDKYGACVFILSVLLFVIFAIVLGASAHDEYTFKGSDVSGVGECASRARSAAIGISEGRVATLQPRSSVATPSAAVA